MNDHLIKELRRECAFAGSAGVLHLPVTVVEALLREIERGEEAKSIVDKYHATLGRAIGGEVAQ